MSSASRHYVLAAGGTGGHLIPAVCQDVADVPVLDGAELQGDEAGHAEDLARLDSLEAGKPITDLAGNVIDANGKPYRQGMVFRCNLDGSEFEVIAPSDEDFV